MIDKIKVAGITYNVGLGEFPQTKNDNIVKWGEIDYDIAEIKINNELAQERQHQTLIHEMVHAMFCEAGISVEDEEDVVNRLGLVLYQVLKDNDFSWVSAEREVTTIRTKEGIVGYIE